MAMIGIDVSKEKLDCFWLKDAVRRTGKAKVFKNMPGEFPALVSWMIAQTGETPAQLHFVMEATGIYHEALAHALHAAGTKVSVVNPALVRDYAKSLGVRYPDRQTRQPGAGALRCARTPAAVATGTG